MCKINKISDHAKNRYAERIMNKEDKIDIILFVQQHENKIKEDIQKMVDYGELVYTGKPIRTITNNSLNNKSNHEVNIFLKDLWVILLDAKTNDCITLYRIDFGLEDDFNKEFVNRMKIKLNDAKTKYIESCNDIESKCKEYSDIISNNEEEIKVYEKYIKSFKKINETYNDAITELQQTKSIAEEEVRSIVGNLIGKKSF